MAASELDSGELTARINWVRDKKEPDSINCLPPWLLADSWLLIQLTTTDNNNNKNNKRGADEQ